MKCRFANARPEPDFRCFSKTAALDSDANSMEATRPQGSGVLGPAAVVGLESASDVGGEAHVVAGRGWHAAEDVNER